MNTTSTQPQTETTKPTTAASVLARIQSEHLVPTPRYAFAMREGSVWGVWGVSVLVGAFALAVTVYDALSMEYALYEATHDNFWTFIVSVLPYLWVLVFAGMAGLAVTGMRQTKRGYRYSTVFILGSSMLCSVFGATLFHIMGFGYALDTLLGHQIEQYMSMEKMDLAMWQAPDQGRLIGVIIPAEVDGSTATVTLQFKDVQGQVWTVSNTELSARDMQLLQSTDRVRLLGTTTDVTTFHICGVFPWMYNRAMGWGEMQHERVRFEQSMMVHRQMNTVTGSVPGGSVPTDQLCAHLKMMARMH